MNKWLLVAVLTCLPPLAVAQSLRCDEKIISTGTGRAQVAALCGDPAQVDRKTVYYQPFAPTANNPNSLSPPLVEVQVEIWTYNFGPDRLMQRIRFEDGIVVRIESLDYGY